MAKRRSRSRGLAVEAYKALIDGCVEQARDHGAAANVVSRKIFSKAPAHRPFNAFVRALSAEQRRLLADMLREERRSAIHDVLAFLTWQIEARGLAFTLEGQALPADLGGMGLHGDFVGRLDGWEWPSGPEAD